MAPPDESSPSPSASQGRVLPAHSADRRKTGISLWNTDGHASHCGTRMGHQNRTAGLGLGQSTHPACRRFRALSSALHKPGLVFHVCNPSTREAEAGGSEIQCHPQPSIVVCQLNSTKPDLERPEAAPTVPLSSAWHGFEGAVHGILSPDIFPLCPPGNPCPAWRTRCKDAELGRRREKEEVAS